MFEKKKLGAFITIATVFCPDIVAHSTWIVATHAVLGFFRFSLIAVKVSESKLFASSYNMFSFRESFS